MKHKVFYRWPGKGILLAAMSYLLWSQTSIGAQLPEVPLLKRDVHLQEQGKHTRPAIPALRVSNDGRIAVDFSSVKQVEFTLLKPEALDKPFDRSANGFGILGGDVAPFNVDRRLFDSSVATAFGSASHHTICDTTPRKSYHSGADRNPYSCPTDPAADCYDLTMISTNMNGGIELWGTPFTVKVKSPKSKNAFIESVEVGTPVKGGFFPGLASFFEPLTTEDGKLLVGRNGFGSAFYSVAPEAGKGCDVTQWTQIHELTHAYFDPKMRVGGTRTVTGGKVQEAPRYGIAAYQMRDAAGNLLPDNALSKITYPWMDKDGNNIVFTSVDATLFYSNGSGTLQERYAAECQVSGTGCIENPTDAQISNVDTPPILRGIGVVGSWTHGKMLQIDNLVNNIDFGTGWGDNQQYKLSLYNGSGDNGKLRIGGAGNIFNPYPAPGHLPLATTGDFTYIIDSVENIFNDIPNMVPSTIRDTVWYLNISKVTDKLVFDEYLNPHVVINAEWIPALIHSDTSVPAGNVPNNAQHYRDGFVSATRTVNGSGFGEAIWFQNAATTLDWQVPSHGVANAPDSNKPVRAEPVAVGGIDGRGLWLFPENNVTFSMPANSKNVDDHSWYVGVFVDGTNGDSTQRRLLTFPDGTSIRLTGRSSVSLHDSSGTQVASFSNLNLGNNNRHWKHLGFKISAGGASVEFYNDGFKADSWSAGSTATRLFRMIQGDLVVGKVAGSSDAGFEGWVDSLLVEARDVGYELACNYAKGSILGLGAGYTGPLSTQASHYPVTSHNGISSMLSQHNKSTYSQYVCYKDYSTDLDIDIRFIPEQTVAVRDALIFPQGPLRVNSPRPNTQSNNFCLACHSDSKVDVKLRTVALSYNGVNVETDTRRQPGQGPRLVFGNLPANHFGIRLPATDIVANSNGSVTDLFTIGCGQADGSCAAASIDTDNDGIFDLLDTDLDGDGVDNFNDAFPNDSSKKSDLDGDRIADSTDSDKDGDGVPDATDAFPTNGLEVADSDNDGIGDNADPDDNNDGVMETFVDAFNQSATSAQPRKVFANKLSGAWQQVDASQPGHLYNGKYVLKYDQGGDGEIGIQRQMLQGSFDATLNLELIDANVGNTMFAWQFEDAETEMQLELHIIGTHVRTGTLVAAIKRQGQSHFQSFGSASVPAVSTGAVGQNTRYGINIKWRQTSGANGSWEIQYNVNGGALATLGSTTATSTSTDTSRTMKLTESGKGRVEIAIEDVTIVPQGSTPPAPTVSINNGSFETSGAAVFGPLLAANNWTFQGDASTLGVMTPDTLGFPAASDGSKSLYVGVDYVAGRSTAGKAFQDIGQSTVGKTYTITASAAADANWPVGYKLSLRDATTDAELAATTASGSVSFSYTETQARSLRIQVETNGVATQGTAKRTSVDNIQISQQ